MLGLQGGPSAAYQPWRRAPPRAGVESSMAELLPPNDYYEVFGPDYTLTPHLEPAKPNQNKREALDKVTPGADSEVNQ